MPLGSRLSHATVLDGRRGKLYDLILGRPGITFLELAHATMGHMGITAHHLYVLERFELVRSYKTNHSRRYYAYAGDPDEDRRHAFLQEPHLRETLELVQAAPGITQAELAARLPPLTRQAVAHRLERLRALGVVDAIPVGRATTYRASPARPVHLVTGPAAIPA